MNKEERFEISVNQEDVQNIINCYEKDIKYIEKLENNWNELKNHLEKMEVLYSYPTEMSERITVQKMLNKMQEIESRK